MFLNEYRLWLKNQIKALSKEESAENFDKQKDIALICYQKCLSQFNEAAKFQGEINLVKLSKQDILSLKGKPIKINEKWYIVESVEIYLPHHMWTSEDIEAYNICPNSMLAVKLAGINSEEGLYYLWRDFNCTWTAYGYMK